MIKHVGSSSVFVVTNRSKGRRSVTLSEQVIVNHNVLSSVRTICCELYKKIFLRPIFSLLLIYIRRFQLLARTFLKKIMHCNANVNQAL